MQRFEEQSEDLKRDGDGRFTGVDSSVEAHLLPEGVCSRAENIRFADGRAVTRPGLCSIGWGVERRMALPAAFVLRAARAIPEGAQTTEIDYGAGISIKMDVAYGSYDWQYRCGVKDGSPHPAPGDIIRAYGGGYYPAIYDRAQVIRYVGDGEVRSTPVQTEYALGSPTPYDAGVKVEGSVDFDLREGFGDVYGATVFADPNGLEGVLLACAGRAWLLRSGQVPQAVAYPDDEVVSGEVRFVQCFDRVIMFRGQDAAPWMWIPQNTQQGGLGAFVHIEQEGAGSGSFLEPIPNGIDGAEFNGRLFVVYGRDRIAVSEVYDYTHYDPVLQALRINEGSSDRIVRLLPFGRQRLLVFFDQSVWVLDNVFGDLSELKGDILTSERGAVAADSVVQIGSDVWFLAEDGVYSLSQTQDAQIQSNATAISEPVAAYVRRINWAAASGAQAVSVDGLYLLAVPVDGSVFNNALLAFDHESGSWQGLWMSDAPVELAHLLKARHAGQRQAVVVTGPGGSDATLRGVLLAMDALAGEDRLCGQVWPVESVVETRAYSYASLAKHRQRGMVLSVARNAASYRIESMAEGVREERLVQDWVEADRSRYMVFGKADYDETNVNDDALAPWREDYSVALPGVLPGRCMAFLTPDPDDLLVRLYFMPDWRRISIASSIDYDPGYLPVFSLGDVIETRGFVAGAMNRQWVANEAATDYGFWCRVSAAEKAALVASCDAVYPLDVGSMWYAMPYDPSVVALGIRSWSMDCRLIRGNSPAPLSGLAPDLEQVVDHRHRPALSGTWVRYRFSNREGRFCVGAVDTGAHAVRMAPNRRS